MCRTLWSTHFGVQGLMSRRRKIADWIRRTMKSSPRRAISGQRLVLTNDTDFLRLSAEACQTGNDFPPVVYWPRSGKRTVQQLIERITPLSAIGDYQSLCNLLFFA
jgi:hypothetical protein